MKPEMAKNEVMVLHTITKEQQGDPNYHANQFGVFLLGLKIGNTVNAGLKVGIPQSGSTSQVYSGLELGGMY